MKTLVSIAIVFACLLGVISPCLSIGIVRGFADDDTPPAIAANTTVAKHGTWVEVRWSGVADADRDSCWFGLFPEGASVSPYVKPYNSTFTAPYTATAPIKYMLCTEADPAFKASGAGARAVYLISARHNVQFYLFHNGYDSPVAIAHSMVIDLIDITSPQQRHLARTHSPTEMRVSWVSPQADDKPSVKYGTDESNLTEVREASSMTYTTADLCGEPAATQGWFDPGYQHTAVMTALPVGGRQRVYYTVGSDAHGWTPVSSFLTPTSPGPEVATTILLTADLGVTEPDGMHYHWMEPEAYQTMNGLAKRHAAAPNANADLLLHIGDLAYATGYEAKWDAFMSAIEPMASTLPWMTAYGNHERDWPSTGTAYDTSEDSGGECGVPTAARFRMPSALALEFDGFYSLDQGNVHVVILNTELSLQVGSTQYMWLEKDLTAVNRSVTPWIVLGSHRPMYSGGSRDPLIATPIEPLLEQHGVDVALWGHVHFAQRTCPLYNSTCGAVDTIQSGGFGGTVHWVIGNGGQSLSNFPKVQAKWSLYQGREWGYNELIAHNSTHLTINMYSDANETLHDTHTIVRTAR